MRKSNHSSDICDYRYSHKPSLKKNIESVHEERKCNICDYSCSLKANLKRHIESIHEGKKPFQCDICSYSCSLKLNLNQFIKKQSHFIVLSGLFIPNGRIEWNSIKVSIMSKRQ